MNRLPTYPVDADGNMLPWVGRNGTAQWLPNEPQRLRLHLEGGSRGRSSVKFQWRDENGRRWEMFVADTLSLMKNTVIDHGVVEGVWHVVKRGTNYGLMPFKEEQ